MKCDDECKMAWRTVKNFRLLSLHGEILSGVEGAVMRELIFFPTPCPCDSWRYKYVTVFGVSPE